jgi:hypothetical protein
MIVKVALELVLNSLDDDDDDDVDTARVMLWLGCLLRSAGEENLTLVKLRCEGDGQQLLFFALLIASLDKSG